MHDGVVGLAQHGGRGMVGAGFGTQNGAAERHEQRRRNAFACNIRDDGSTYIYMEIVTYGDAGDNLTCYAVDAGQNRILTGSIVKPGEGGNTTAYWWLQYTASAGGLDVAGFELVLAGGDIPLLVDGAVTATYNTIGGINLPGLGNTITVNTQTVTQLNVYLVKFFYDVSFVNINRLYDGILSQNLSITFGVGSPNVRLLHYFNAAPVSPNPVYWRVRNISTQYQDTSFYAENLAAGNFGIDLVTNFNNGLTGTFRQIGTLYISANALLDNTRRAVLKNGILANVCAVG